MIHLPDKILQNHPPSYKVWDTFYAKLPPGSEIDHLCIIVHIEKDSEKVLYYFYMTSKEANCRKAMRNDLGALVELSPEDVSDYFNSPQKSFIKCNAPNLNKISFLDLNHISSKDTRDKSKLRISNDIKQKILSAVTATQTMPDSIREVILNNASI